MYTINRIKVGIDMVLRKPYAFIIKNFKVLHLAISVFFTYISIRIVNLIVLCNDFLKSEEYLISTSSFKSMFNIFDFIIPVVLFIFVGLIQLIMAMKKKPNKFYIFGTVYSLFLLCINVYTYNLLKKMTTIWLEAATVSTLSEFYVFLFVCSTVLAAFSLARTFGFNIGRFDFTSEALKIERNESDGEEVEIKIEYDTSDVRRSLQKNIRYIKYFYRENKRNMTICLLVAAGIVSIYTFTTILRYNKKVVSGDTLSYAGFNIKINQAYVINKDTNGQRIPGNKHLLLLDVDITNNNRTSMSFPVGAASVTIGTKEFYATQLYEDYVVDFGKVYKEEKINSLNSKGKPVTTGSKANTLNRLLVFEIPKSLILSKSYFAIKTNKGTFNFKDKERFTYIKINKKNYLDVKEKINEFDINEEIILNDTLLSGFKINVKNFNVQSYYKLQYNFCMYSGKCLNSYEYLYPNNANYNEDKAVMRLEYDFKKGSNSVIATFKDMLNKYGKLNYKVKGKEYEVKKFNFLNPKNAKFNNVYFLEVDKNILEADNLSISFSIRGFTYKYILKGEQ